MAETRGRCVSHFRRPESSLGASKPQRYANFKVVNVPNRKPGIRYLTDSKLNIERLPSPQDWVFVMEKVDD